MRSIKQVTDEKNRLIKRVQILMTMERRDEIEGLFHLINALRWVNRESDISPSALLEGKVASSKRRLRILRVMIDEALDKK